MYYYVLGKVFLTGHYSDGAEESPDMGLQEWNEIFPKRKRMVSVSETRV